MAYVGLANDVAKDADAKLAAYHKSLAVGEMSGWFANRSNEMSDIARQLVFLSAMNHAYIWFAENNPSDKREFDLAVSQFTQYIKMPDSVPHWAEFHLSCLYATASAASESAEYKNIARDYLVKSLHDLRKNQNEKSPIQRTMMRCRIKHPTDCERPRASEAMICGVLYEMFGKDPEIDGLVGKL